VTQFLLRNAAAAARWQARGPQTSIGVDW